MRPQKMSEDAQKSDLRNRILNYIQLHPRISRTNIKKVLGISESTLRYHLRVLEKNGLIKCKFEDSKEIIYSTTDESTKDFSVSRDRIIYTIKNNNGISQKDLIIKTRLDRAIVSKQVKKLVKTQIIVTEKKGREVYHYYRPLKDIREIIKKYALGMIDEDAYWELVKNL